jgi:hypothetical protein
MEVVTLIEPFEPSMASSPGERAAIHDLIVQPAAPWFSEVERRHVEGALSGEFGAVARDRFWVAWVGPEPVANIYFSTAAGAPEIGLVGAPRGVGRFCGRGWLVHAPCH